MIAVYWLEQTEADVPLLNDWLGRGEVLRLNSMRFNKRRREWRLGRWTAKNAVASYLRLPYEMCSLAEIQIVSASSGAPEVCFAKSPAEITISLSHREGMAACAVAGCKMALGCDLETIEPRSDAFLSDYFTLEEQRLVVTDRAGRDLLLNLLWSAKESALKALCTGLRADTRCVAVCPSVPPFEVGTWHRLQVRHLSGRVFDGWWKQSGGLVRTVVADCAGDPPVPLRTSGRIEGTHATVQEESTNFSLT